jgi:hypothetical protein
MTLREIEAALEEADAQVVGLMVRNEVRVTAPIPGARSRRRHPGHRGRGRRRWPTRCRLGLKLEEANRSAGRRTSPDG